MIPAPLRAFWSPIPKTAVANNAVFERWQVQLETSDMQGYGHFPPFRRLPLAAAQ